MRVIIIYSLNDYSNRILNVKCHCNLFEFFLQGRYLDNFEKPWMSKLEDYIKDDKKYRLNWFT